MRHRAPLVDGMPTTPRIEGLGLAEGAREGLELRLGDVVRVAAAHEFEVHGEARREGDRLEEVAHHRSGEVPADEVELEAGRLADVHEVRATRDVDDGLRERLVEGNEGVAVAGDSALVSEGLPDGLAEHDPGVLDGVVHVDVGVAARAHGEVGERVLREGREHVVEERNRRLDVARAGSVEVHRQVDARFARRALDAGRTGGSLAHAQILFGAWSAMASRKARGLGLGTCAHPQGVRDSDIAHEDAAGQQRLEDRVRVVDPAEQHEVARTAVRPGSRARRASTTMRSRWTRMSSTMASSSGGVRQRRLTPPPG